MIITEKYLHFKTLIIIILFVSLGFCQLSESDSSAVHKKVVGYDKIQHAAVSCLLTLSGQYVLEQKGNFTQEEALSYSVSTSALIGLTKEFNDIEINKQRFNWGDMVANLIGIGLAVVLISL